MENTSNAIEQNFSRHCDSRGLGDGNSSNKCHEGRWTALWENRCEMRTSCKWHLLFVLQWEVALISRMWVKWSACGFPGSGHPSLTSLLGEKEGYGPSQLCLVCKEAAAVALNVVSGWPMPSLVISISKDCVILCHVAEWGEMVCLNTRVRT